MDFVLKNEIITIGEAMQILNVYYIEHKEDYVRDCLRRLVKTGQLEKVDDYLFKLKDDKR